jgi:hypothetical protein
MTGDRISVVRSNLILEGGWGFYGAVVGGLHVLNGNYNTPKMLKFQLSYSSDTCIRCEILFHSSS